MITGKLGRFSRLGTLPSAKLRDRYAQMAASSGASVRKRLVRIPSFTTSKDGLATSAKLSGVSRAVMSTRDPRGSGE